MAPERLRDVHLESGRRFVALVTIGGLIALGALVSSADPRWFLHAPIAFWILALFAVVGEMFPIKAPRADDHEEIGTSTTFGFAILLAFGGPAAALVFALASALADLLQRRSLWKLLFNIAQYTLSVAAAGVVLDAAGATGSVMVAANFWAYAAAAVVFFVVNDLVTGIAIAMTVDEPVMPYLRSDLTFQTATATALFAMAPVVLAVADEGVWLLPLLFVPVAAIYWGATKSLENAELARQLSGALEQEKELGRMKDDFAAVVSHELRTPLTSIQGYVKTLLQLGDGLEQEQQRSFLEAADRQSERLRRLIEQLLAVARIQTNADPVTPTVVSLSHLGRYVVDELGQVARGHTFDLRLDDLPLIESDEGKLHQIVANLVENAIKYAPPDTRITLRGVDTGDGVMLSVEDEGRGIALEDQERIFDRFYQADTSATRSVGGTGLGLYICRKLAEQVSGRLWLERTSTSGSVFCLWVPAVPPNLEQTDDAEPGRDLGVSSPASASA